MRLDEITWYEEPLDDFNPGGWYNIARCTPYVEIMKHNDGTYSILARENEWSHVDAATAQCVLYELAEWGERK